ncbi:ribonucleotide reductase inhibitor protein [Rutstroemia sp. NJR-2017a BVV2]|nr:ribonucleotide reductase inhibitor protein [Rutstroemia sp. NJR-2017a BVV2]
MPSHIHQAKRPYAGSHSQSQSAITNYFSPTSLLPSAAPPPAPAQPTLPHPIQSSLLSVGMRIRKSVPEGYKTGDPYSSFSLFSESNNPNSTSTSTLTPKYKGTRPRAGMRELTPFCGLMKTGGLGVQGQQWDYSIGGEVIEDGDEEEEGEGEGWGSQDSVGSYGRGSAAKRRFLDDAEGEGEEANDENGPGRILMDSGFGGRKIAVPRSRKAMKSGGGRSSLGGDENANMDFEEAEFLDYGLAADEVQMGGL